MGAWPGVDIGGNAFGWRLPGVLVGALTAALAYLLARVLFARRSIGLITAALVLAEGMLFANARIAMNDAYVTAFVLLAVLLLAPLYLAPRRPWTAAALVLGAGVALGLALASKWVALYAIGGLGLLVLLRSALGRALALLVMVSMTAVLGTMAIRPEAGPDVVRNWVFLVLMLLLTRPAGGGHHPPTHPLDQGGGGAGGGPAPGRGGGLVPAAPVGAGRPGHDGRRGHGGGGSDRHR